ncbi:condensation domain-containing protein [Actinomadura kijaniata]|uniref:condensation domain-containing protein n=1 Tax=Actinomadura kijaniata TaxID=46161 RepID=UPI00082DD1B5|nr:condensation domain-containing protein [Actinomadura kijaniata]
METTRHTVAFSAPHTARSGPLSWAQLEVWPEALLSQQGLATYVNIVGGGPLPPGLKAQDVVEALGRLMERHEPLRTRFRTRPDGHPEQVVVPEGEIEIEVVDLPADEDPFEAVHAWLPAMEDTPYDLAAGLPFRARIGAVEGEPLLVMFGTTHLSADFLGTRVLYGELVSLLEGRELAGAPPLHPIDLAESERAEAGRRVLNRSLDHWRAELSAAPPAMFPAPTGPGQAERYWRGGINSQVAARALREAAARCGIGTSYVLLAAMTALVGRHTGKDRCSLRAVVGNRGRPETRHSIANLSMEAPLVVDLCADTLQQVARTARTAFLRAQRHGRCDPEAAARLLTEHGVELDVVFNDMWTPARGAAGTGTPTGPPADTSFRWEERTDRATVAFFLEAFEVIGDPEAMRLSLLADTRHLPPERIRAFLYAIERLLVVFAERDVRLDEIDPVS